MTTIIDARGLSCPQPVLLTLEAIQKKEEKELVVLVDTDTAKENVSRAAVSQGYRVKEVQADGAGYTITLTRN